MTDSQTVVKALVEVDPGFVALCETLFGKAVDAAEVWDFLYTPDGVERMGPGIAKMSPDPADLHAPAAITRPAKGILVPKTTNAPMPAVKAQVAQTVPPAKKQAVPVQTGVGKAEDEVDVVWAGEFAKRDNPRRQAFGWASIVEVNGAPIVDLQGDLITPEDLEDAAYAYVHKSRVGGDQHARDEYGPIQAGHLIESVVYTDEKYSALAKAANLPDQAFAEAPRGWWVGFQYSPGKTWDDIASGRKTGFSVHGIGKRMPLAG